MSTSSGSLGVVSAGATARGVTGGGVSGGGVAGGGVIGGGSVSGDSVRGGMTGCSVGGGGVTRVNMDMGVNRVPTRNPPTPKTKAITTTRTIIIRILPSEDFDSSFCRGWPHSGQQNADCSVVMGCLRYARSQLVTLLQIPVFSAMWAETAPFIDGSRPIGKP